MAASSGRGIQTLFKALFRFHDQEIFGGHVARRELRQEVFAETHGNVTALGISRCFPALPGCRRAHISSSLRMYCCDE